MKLFGKTISPTGEAIIRVAIFSVITVVAIITAILTSFMITDSGTKEYNWWVALMCMSWTAFGVLCLATAVSSVKLYRLVKKTAGYASVGEEGIELEDLDKKET